MQICVLGGCGDMAKVALELLAKEDDVTSITIADINVDKAQQIAKNLGFKFSAKFVNAKDRASLIDAVRGHNVALGFIGPFYMFEHDIIDACLDAKVPYVSICDDYDAYLSAITLNEKAKDAGITVIAGLGNSPGITNLLAKKGYVSLDKPERIEINWAGGSDEDIGPANVKHVLHIFSGYTLQWRDGKEVKIKTGTERKIVEFPEPMGKLPVYITGHAESVSVPRNLPGLTYVSLHGGIHPPYIARLATFLGSLGLTNTSRKREILTKILLPLVNMGIFSKGGIDQSVFRIDVYGEKNGKPTHHYYSGVGHIAEITSIPAVEGALMIARGELNKPGVHSAESAIDDVDAFLNRLKNRNVKLFYYEE
ncbi:MAG TPA: saccharopine dehydrogenase NADP-binding domain-containing protein [Candidatus Hydrogenedens sp.]|mgnify:CR=1 FL=1|nr:saccharopine dehydrogenase NADP-binding domain-containing protein [Candidatus Hydrogenedens sp.]HOL21106.1 saccharopine dehydrogenase NADP-binding domain-containing protein [Candidatus Hydrogenedens sp.]HPP57744.1 saccharopine dehydrogenase NADP-binding domain-containing protein [Candidatus Hydrogenedens sp.]